MQTDLTYLDKQVSRCPQYTASIKINFMIILQLCKVDDVAEVTNCKKKEVTQEMGDQMSPV